MQKVAIIVHLVCFFVIGNSIENLAIENTTTTDLIAANLIEKGLANVIV